MRLMARQAPQRAMPMNTYLMCASAVFQSSCTHEPVFNLLCCPCLQHFEYIIFECLFALARCRILKNRTTSALDGNRIAKAVKRRRAQLNVQNGKVRHWVWWHDWVCTAYKDGKGSQ